MDEMAQIKGAFARLGVLGIGTLCLIAVTPESSAERSTTQAGVDAISIASVESVGAQLDQPAALDAGRGAIARARRLAHYGALSERAGDALVVAREDLARGRHAEAQELTLTLLEKLAPPADRAPRGAQRDVIDKANLLLARAYLGGERPEDALTALEAMSGKSPVEDYRFWLRANALTALERWDEARAAYLVVAKEDGSPMTHRARVAAAHTLYDATKWEEAERALGRVNTLYPDYPRRHISLYEYARSLDMQNKLEEAAEAYQKTWFEYPYKQRGVRALERLDELGAMGHVPAAIPEEDLFKRYRWLRINKHWDVAKRLFRELEGSITAERGEHDEVVHKIWYELGKNAYIPKRYEESLVHFTRLKDAYEAGHTDGVDPEDMYRYYAIVVAKFGRLDEAVAALDKSNAKARPRDRAIAKAEFLADHARYARARKVYDGILTDAQKLGWDYTWLLYKTGAFESATQNFERLAQRSSGRTKAKYMYWFARGLERWGKPKEAKAAFKAVIAKHRTTYYGMQAANRLDDMKTRRTLGSSVLVQRDRVERAAEAALGAFDAPTDSTRVALGDDRAQQMAEGDVGAPAVASRPVCKGDESSGPCAVMRSLGVATPPRALDTTTGEELASYTQTPADELAMRARLGQLQRETYTSGDNRKERVAFAHDARIHWEGRDDSPLVFDRYDGGEAIGPHPEEPRAYVDAKYDGGLDRARDEIGELFPELERARWLVDVGMLKEARWAVREVSLEFRRLYKLSPPRSTPHQLPDKRMIPYIDNRREKRATWGYIENEYKWPVPSSAKGRKKMLDRQREIITNKRDILVPLVAALKEVGDFYMVRKYTLDYRIGRGSERLSQLYPRAFPDQVLPVAEYYGVNPYMIWALMTVESSFNPDSVSTAAALGLLQVIPRTGLKTAALLGEEDFGHYDLLDEDVAVKHGTFYIGRVVRKFHGQELLAFAGYNGGPHRVAEWLDQRGDQPLDEFIEEIPYNQAREYSKKVTRFIGLYMRLYEGEDRLYIGQNLRRDYKAQPNF